MFMMLTGYLKCGKEYSGQSVPEHALECHGRQGKPQVPAAGAGSPDLSAVYGGYGCV